MRIEEYDLLSKDGEKLYGKAWLPEEGQEPLAAICLVHGFCEHSGRYKEFAEFFVRNQIAVFSFDLRGHGDTEHTEGEYTFQQIGEDVASVIQTMGLEGSIGVGHSAGGMSMLIADSLVPGIIGKGVLVDTRVGDSPMALLSPDEQKVRMERNLQKRSIWESREAMYSAYRDRLLARPMSIPL